MAVPARLRAFGISELRASGTVWAALHRRKP